MLYIIDVIKRKQQLFISVETERSSILFRAENDNRCLILAETAEEIKNRLGYIFERAGTQY